MLMLGLFRGMNARFHVVSCFSFIGGVWQLGWNTLYQIFEMLLKKKKLCVFVLCFNVLISQINLKK
jgi:hypothetical protein